MKHRGAAALAAALAAVVGAGWWLAPDDSSAPALRAMPAQAALPGSGAVASSTASRTGQPLQPAQRQPDAADPRADAFLTADLRFKLEALLLEAGDSGSPAALKQRLAALVPQQFSAADRERALALLNRYVDYRVALGKVKAPADPNDPRALRTALEARQRLREKHFDSSEYDALFDSEEALDRFMLARLEIERNNALTPTQQQAAVRQAENELSDAQRAARAGALAHEAVAAQTAAFDKQGASPQERHAQRRAQYGDAAAAQLARLDSEEHHWQARLDGYAGAKNGNASPAQLEQLGQQLFSAEEQLRLEAALALRQQQAVTPQKR
ncbi:MAG: hypothetical protein JWR60_248 [Polaromonas sp.]|nr:hypothetical protein [Polaromonas sp.]